MTDRSVRYIVKPECGMVICIIKEDYFTSFRGIAKCSPEDTFNEETGKRIAYLRACKKRKRYFIQDAKEDIKLYKSAIDEYEARIAQRMRRIDSMRKSIAVYSEEIDSLA